MSRSTLAPVFTGLRIGLHSLLLGLTAFAVVRAFVTDSPRAWPALIVAALFAAVYTAGVLAARADAQFLARQRSALAWVSLLTLLWALLVWCSPEGAFVVFPLFFVYLHVLPGAGGVVSVVLAAAFAILALGLHLGFSVGGIVGPIIGAGVAVLIGLAYRALIRESEEREHLLSELIRTRHRLAETEREQGALAERARLARDIHDTVAQGLSSIQMLLHAAERDTPEPGAGYLRLARETAADSLADTRQIIRELTPSTLDDGLAAALGRLGDEQQQRSGIRIDVEAEDLELPMDVQTALLRIAQGALSNALRHARASLVSIGLRAVGPGTVELVIADDGCGFDTSRAATASHGSDSFGLQAMRERAAQLHGSIDLRSVVSAGSTGETGTSTGTTVTARFPIGDRP